MFSIHCDSHGAEVLLSARNITAIHNDAQGMSVHWRCTCGNTGSFRSGRARRPAAA